MVAIVHLRFDGRSARENHLDMGLLGRSLIGTDRVIRDGLFVAIEGRMPRRRERLPVTIQATAPVAGSVDIQTLIESSVGVLPFIHEMLVATGTAYIKHFLAYVLFTLGGRSKDAEPNVKAMIEALVEIHRSEIDDRRHERLTHFESEEMWRRHTLELADKLRPAVRDMVAPIGPEADTLSIADDKTLPAVIDVPMADAIRAKERVEVGDLEMMTLRLDGITLHNRSVKIEVPERPGRFVTAEVRDPAFDDPHGPYSQVLGEEIKVQVKPMRKPNGDLVKLYIMNLLGD